MKKELRQILLEYFFTHVQLKKTPENLTKILVKTSGIKMVENGIRKKFSEKFLEEKNACTFEEALSNVVFKTYSNEEVFFLIKSENDKKEIDYFILRHFRSRKADFYFAINIMPKEEFDFEKVMPSAVFFYKN